MCINFCNLKSIKLLFSLDSAWFMYIKVESSFFSFILCLSSYTLFDVLSCIYLSIYLHILTSRVENFKSILDFNSLTRLKYLSWTSWLDLNTWVKNSDLNQVLISRELDSISMTWLDAISLIIKEYLNKKLFILCIMNIYDNDIININEEVSLFVRKV